MASKIFQRILIFCASWTIILVIIFGIHTKLWTDEGGRQSAFFMEMQTSQFYAYSSYYYTYATNQTFVKVIGVGVTKTLRKNSITCTFRNKENKTLEIILGNNSAQGISPGRKYQVVVINCPFPTQVEFHPEEISISSNFLNSTFNFIPITYPPVAKKPLYKLAMCVQPFYSDFEDPIGLIEWIEFHSLLGAEHFTFYSNSMGPLTRQVLESYGKKAQILEWKLPFNSDWIQNIGQPAQINDCVFRYKGVAEWVGSVDVDEFIIPGNKYLQEFKSFKDLFQDIIKDEGKGRVVGGIRFVSVFSFNQFPRSIPKFGEGIANKLKILTRQRFTPSTHYIYKHKFVVKPEMALRSGVHSLWTIPNTVVLTVTENKMHFNHYRNCSKQYIKDYCRLKCERCGSMKGAWEDPSVGNKFGEDLVFNVWKKVESLDLVSLSL